MSRDRFKSWQPVIEFAVFAGELIASPFYRAWRKLTGRGGS